MAINSVDIHLNAFANFSPVFAEVTKLKAAMAEMQSSSFGNTLTSDYVSGLQKAQQQFTSLVQSTRAFNVQSVQMTDSVSQFSKQLESGQLKLGQYYSIWKQSAKGVSTELDSLATQQARVARSVVIPDTLHAGYAQVITDLNGVVTETEKASFYQTAYNTTLRDGANKLIDFGKNMQWAGRQLTVGLTVPMALFANQAAQSYLSFDKAMTDMLKVYGSQAVVQSQQALDTIRTEVTDLATNLAHTIGVTMTDTVTIAQTFSQMGITGQDLLKTTDATAKLMKIGGLTAAGSSQAAIAMQNVFKLQSSQMTDAINFLNAAKHSTSTSMQDIIEAMPKVGPIITQLGGSYKDFATLLVALRENGVPASQAANTIKSMFATLVNPTTRAIKDFDALGISLKGIVSQDANNPLKMLTDLQTALDKLPSQQRVKAIEELFGKFQFARADALISSLGAAGSQNEKVMQLYNSSTAELAAVAQQEIDIASKGTPAAQYAKMKASLQADLIPVGREFLVVMTKIGNAVDGIVKFFDKLGAMKNILAGGLAVAALIGPLVMFTGLFSNLVGTIFKGLNYLRMFKEGYVQATDVNPVERFNAGLKNMTNFYKEIDVNALAASHSTDLMELSAQNSAKAFDVLATAIRNLTTQIAALNAVSVNPTGLVSELQSTIANAGMAAKAATGAAQMELPLMLADGGYVPGVGNSDSQPAFLTPGEAVIPKDKARKYAPFINAMINGTVGTFNGGLPAEASKNTNFTHLALTQEGGIQYLASELFAIYKDGGMKLTQLGLNIIEELASKETQMVAGLVAKGYSEIEAQGMLPKFAGLGSLGFTLDAKLNNQMGKPGGASTQAVAQDFEAQGLAKWNKSLQKAGLVTDSYTELSEEMQSQLKQLDSSILAEIKSHKGLTIRDTDLTTSYIKIQDTIPELSASQSRLIREFNTLAFTLTDWRTRFSGTEEAFIAGGYNVEDHTTASGSSYKQIRIAGSPKRLGSQNNALGAGLVPSPKIIQEQMSAWEAVTEGQISTAIAKIEESLTVKLSSAVDNSVMATLSSGRKTAGAASPAEEFISNLGEPIGQGIAVGIENEIPTIEKAATTSVKAATAASKKSLQMELPFAQESIKEFSANMWVPAEEAAATAGAEAGVQFNTALEEQLGSGESISSKSGLLSRFKNSRMGMGGAGMGIAMAAPMLTGMLPQGGISSAVSNVSSMAGMGMMASMAFGPEAAPIGLALGAAVGGAKTLFDMISKRSAEVAAEWNANTTTSVSDLQIFKSTALNTSIVTKNLAIENVNLSSKTNVLKGNIIDLGNAMTSADPSIQSMISAIKNLPKGDPLGDLVKNISDSTYKISGVIGNLKQNVQNAISTGGLDPSKSKQYVYSALAASGRTSDFAQVWKEISRSIGYNEKAGKADSSKTTTSSLNTLSNNQDFIKSEVNYSSASKSFDLAQYKDLSGAAKTYADQLKNLYAITSNGSLGFKEMQARINGVKSATGDTSTALDLLEKTIIGTGSADDIKRLSQVEGYIKAMGPNAKLSASEIMKMNAVLQVMTPDQLKAWADANGKKLGVSAASKMGAIIDAYAKSGDFQKAIDAANKAIMNGINGSTSSATSVPTVTTPPDYAKQYKGVDTALNNAKKLIDNLASAQKKYNDQLKATQDFQIKQMDYFNQMKMALTSGNYLGAMQAQQSAVANQADFRGTLQQQALTDRAAKVATMQAEISDARANNLSLAAAEKQYPDIAKYIKSKYNNSQFFGGVSAKTMTSQANQYSSDALSLIKQSTAATAGNNPFNSVEITINADNSVIPADFAATVQQSITAALAKAATKGNTSHNTKSAPRSGKVTVKHRP